MKTSIVAVLLCLSSAACSRSGSSVGPDAVVLPQPAGLQILNQCSRNAPPVGQATWEPSAADIELLEAQLLPALKADPRSREIIGLNPPSGWRRQYIGITHNGERTLYGNFFPKDALSGDRWLTEPVSVCDGGPAFFGVEFDMATGRISRLEFNGVA